MKKGLTFFVLSVLLVSLSMGFVSAAPITEGAKSFTTGAYEVIRPILEVVIGETTNPDTFLAKVLFLVIIFSVMWMALSKVSFFSENAWVLWGISIAASVLAIRWFGSSEVIRTVILPYSAFGVAITSGLPFLLFFFVVKDFTKTMRKVSWIFFGVIFMGLWIMRSGATDANVVGSGVGNFAYIYLVTAILAVMMLMFDGTIHRTLARIKAEKAMSYKDLERKHRIMEDLDNARELRTKARTKTEMGLANAEIKRLEKLLDTLP